MTRIVKLRIDRLRLDRSAAGPTGALPGELRQALRAALIARRDGDTPAWPVTTRPALRRPADTLARLVPVTDQGGEA